MKFRTKNIAKAFSLSIIFSFFVVGLHANSWKIKYNIHTAEKQAQKKIVNSHNMQLFNDSDIIEEQKEIECWMLQLQLQNDPFSEQRQLEKWMFDHNFWYIIEIDKKEEIIEEPREVEDWMDTFESNATNLAKIESSGIHTHLFYEDAFLIL